MSDLHQNIVIALANLDASQDKVENAARQFIAIEEETPEKASESVQLWMEALRQTETSDRLPFLYLANHLMQSKTTISYQEEFSPYTEEAVSLVCNHPGFREEVGRLLSVWQTRKVFDEQVIAKLWKCTGEEDTSDNDQTKEVESNVAIVDVIKPSSDVNPSGDPGAMDHLNRETMHGVVNALKQMDKNQLTIQFFETKVKDETQLQKILTAAEYLHNPQEIVDFVENEQKLDPAERPIGSTKQLKKTVEQAILLLRETQKCYNQWEVVEQRLRETAKQHVEDEKEKREATEESLNNCDWMDTALLDLQDHRTQFPEHWRGHALINQSRKRRREEEASKKAEQIRLRQQKFIAASKAAEAEQSRVRMEEALAKQAREAQKEDKKSSESTMIWHPVLKELVAVPSSQHDSEDWRDCH